MMCSSLLGDEERNAREFDITPITLKEYPSHDPSVHLGKNLEYLRATNKFCPPVYRNRYFVYFSGLGCVLGLPLNSGVVASSTKG